MVNEKEIVKKYVCINCNKILSTDNPNIFWPNKELRPTKCTCGAKNSWFNLNLSKERQIYGQIKDLELESQIINRNK